MDETGEKPRALLQAALTITSKLSLDVALKKIVDTARALAQARYAALGVAREDRRGLSQFHVAPCSERPVNPSNHLLVFTLDKQRFGLHLFAVERVVRAVEVTPLPKAPEIVLGIINVQGRIIPVVNIRKRFRLPERGIELSDQLIIAHTSRRTVALIVDAVSGVIERSEQEVIAAEKILPGMEYVEGVVKLEEGIALIHDLDRFLSLDEEKALDEAMG